MGLAESSELHREQVLLHVYDFKGTSRLNGALRTLGTGIFHAGIEVYGWEYTFEQKVDEDFRPVLTTGICRDSPKSNNGYVHRETIDLGSTFFSEKEVSRIIESMRDRWRSEDYNIMQCNCTHFCQDLCDKLRVRGLPPWLTSAAQLGSNLLLSDLDILASARPEPSESRQALKEHLLFEGKNFQGKNEGFDQVVDFCDVHTPRHHERAFCSAMSLFS